MIPEQFALLTIALSFVGGLNYVVGTLKGQTKPNRVTWGLLGLFTAIVLVAQVDSGVSWPLVSAGISLFNIAAIFIASFVNPKAYWKTEPEDYAFGVIALAGFALWQLTNNPGLAISFSIVADFSASMPTFVKAYKQPSSENGRAFVLWTVAHSIVLLIIKDWTFASYAFPLYLVLFNAAMAYLVVLRPKLAR